MVSYRRGRDELKVGLFGVAAVTVFVLMFGTLTSRGVIRYTSDLYLVLSSAEGLLKGDAVLYRGVPVGDVRGIGFMEDGRVVVRAKLRREVPITERAGAALVPVDMFGRQSIVLRDGVGGRSLASGDTLAADRPRPLPDRVEAIGSQVQRFLGDSTLELVHRALGGVGSAGGEIGAAGAEVRALLLEQGRNLDELAGATNAVVRSLAVVTDSAELASLLVDLRAAVGDLARTSEKMDAAAASAASMLAKIDGGAGSLGLLVNDSTLYSQVVRLLGEFEQLATDVREHPKRYLTVRVF
jgi:phospholipid/cholesterol/gamma-HCH transport system substrate-binding protein